MTRVISTSAALGVALLIAASMATAHASGDRAATRVQFVASLTVCEEGLDNEEAVERLYQSLQYSQPWNREVVCEPASSGAPEAEAAVIQCVREPETLADLTVWHNETRDVFMACATAVGGGARERR
jgi:hypothetical protein